MVTVMGGESAWLTLGLCAVHLGFGAVHRKLHDAAREIGQKSRLNQDAFGRNGAFFSLAEFLMPVV
jgi:hypothetical protein